MILAIESGEECSSVAIGSYDHISSVTLTQPRSSEQLLEVVNYLREERESQITAVAVCIGPGSYTGLRTGLALCQGLACGLNVPLIGVSSFIAALYLNPLEDKSYKVGCRLREGEAAVCIFNVKGRGKELYQPDAVTYCVPEEAPIMPITAEGVLRAADLIQNFSPVLDGPVQFVRTTGNEPISPVYLKPVQAKTLVERGVV